MVTQPASPCDIVEVEYPSLLCASSFPSRRTHKRSHQRQWSRICKIDGVDVVASPTQHSDDSKASDAGLCENTKCESGCNEILCNPDPAFQWCNEILCNPGTAFTDAASMLDLAKCQDEALSPKLHMLGGKHLAYCTIVEEQGLAKQNLSRRVHFDDECIVYEIQPCAEIYGMHPRDFIFDKNYGLVPILGWTCQTSMTGQGFSENDEGDESDLDDDFGSDVWEVTYVIS